MRKLTMILTLFTLVFVLTSCAQATVVCGEGTVIKDGQCVAPTTDDNTDTPTDNETPVDVNCDSITGEIFYEANFTDLQNSFVTNEPGDLHDQSNFVIWGQGNDVFLANQATVENGSLVVNGLSGTQLDQFHNTGLGYQYFAYENDHTYTVCAVVEGPTGQSLYSEIGIYYGFGTKDEVVLEGTPQVIIQDFRPTLTTNTDRGQYVIFMGNITGELKIHSIKIVQND